MFSRRSALAAMLSFVAWPFGGRRQPEPDVSVRIEFDEEFAAKLRDGINELFKDGNPSRLIISAPTQCAIDVELEAVFEDSDGKFKPV